MDNFLLEQYLLEVQDRALDHLILEQYDADNVCILEDEKKAPEIVTEATPEQIAKAREADKRARAKKEAETKARREKQAGARETAKVKMAERKLSEPGATTGEKVAAGAIIAKKKAKEQAIATGKQIKSTIKKVVAGSGQAAQMAKERLGKLAGQAKTATGEAKTKAVGALGKAKDFLKQKAAKLNLSKLYNSSTGEQVIAGIKKYGPIAGAAALAGLAAFGAAKIYKKYFSAAGKACKGDAACIKKFKLAAAMKAKAGLASSLSAAKDPKSKEKIQGQIAKWNSKIAKLKG